MDASLKTVVHRFGISKGAVLPSPQNTAVTEAATIAGARRSRGSLYILVEVMGGLPDPGYTVARLIETIEEQYYEGTGSTTGAISASLRAANEWLFEENLNSPREQRGVAGVTCAAIRDEQLFIGQIGPALSYILQADGLRRFPEESPWLVQAIPSDAERAASPPIGVRRAIEPQLYYAAIAPGDALMLTSAAVARAVPSEAIAGALVQGAAGAAERMQELLRERDVNVLIVGVESGVTVVETTTPAPVVAAPEPELPRERPVRPAPRVERAPQAKPIVPLEAVKGGVSSATAALGRLLRRAAPERPARGQAFRAEKPAGGRSNVRMVAILAALVPVVILAVVKATRFQYDRSRRAQVSELLRQASATRESAGTTGQTEDLRNGLQQTVLLIDQALELAPDDPTALAMRQETMDELDAASNVQRLYTMWDLADLGPEAADSLEPARVLVHGSDIFVLDRATDRAYHRLLTPAGDALEVPAPEQPLVQMGQSLGSISVGELVDQVWMPAGGARSGSSLLLLERNGSLLEWESGEDLSVLPVADSAGWRKPQAAGAYMGNFYLLDPQQNRILKYLPTAEGYTDPPVDYLNAPNEVDLSGAVDMGIDGHIYVLLADGTILKFLSGEQVSFQVNGLDQPLANPVAMFVTGEDDTHGYIYVADAGLARVVQFTKQGDFVRQFRAAEGQTQLDRVRGLYVDETTQRLYVVSGSKLYMAPLVQNGPVQPTPTPEGQASAAGTEG